MDSTAKNIMQHLFLDEMFANMNTDKYFAFNT
jgi:hypothetical protein